MSQYTNFQNMFTAALGEYRDKGFSIEAPDDHFAILYHHDEKLAVFSQQGMTIKELHLECERHLAEHYVKELTGGQNCLLSGEARCSLPTDITCASARCPVWGKSMAVLDKVMEEK